jgi:hypothetical protein
VNFGNERESKNFVEHPPLAYLYAKYKEQSDLNPRGFSQEPPPTPSELKNKADDVAVTSILKSKMLRSLFNIKTYPANDGSGIEYYDWGGTIYWNGHNGVPPKR